MDITQLFARKLGFGAMRLPGADKKNIDYPQVCDMVDMFLERGFNYFDTAFVYAGSEDALRNCLTSRHSRDSYLLTDKLPPWNRRSFADYQKAMETSLKRCGVDYFDIYLMHNMGKPTYPQVQAAGGFDFLAKAKADGKARYIGFSFHDSPEYLEQILCDHPEVDIVQLQINYADWENPAIQSRACYEVARRHDKPVIVMEPVKGGGLANLPEGARAYLDVLGSGSSAASYAIRYAASLEGVAAVLSGMSDLDQVRDNTAYMADFKPLTALEYEAIEKVREYLSRSGEIACTNCRYCVDTCPKHIPIPNLFSLYNGVKQHGKANFPAMLYERATLGCGMAGDCIGCGACESHCPQHLPIREDLKLVAKTFE